MDTYRGPTLHQYPPPPPNQIGQPGPPPHYSGPYAQQHPAAPEHPAQLPSIASHPSYGVWQQQPPAGSAQLPPAHGILPGHHNPQDRASGSMSRANSFAMAGPSPISMPQDEKELFKDGVLPEHKDPVSRALQKDGRIYSLTVPQQPLRARMCGFGDKDRRAVTPPPCVRLAVLDAATGQEINPDDIDVQHYLVLVELWTYDGTTDVTMVRNAQSSGSSTAIPPQYRAMGNVPSPQSYAPQYPGNGYPPSASSGYQERSPYQTEPQGPGYPYSPQQVQPYQAGYSQYLSSGPRNGSVSGFQGRYPQELDRTARQQTQASQQSNGLFSRNLIGQKVSHASKLFDDKKVPGIWFVMQDLSVRIEGWFRLRFSFVNVGLPGTTTNGQSSDLTLINTDKAPVLAVTYSEPFQVHSAKKFPGVVESTPLSKAFAGQGVKIPIRKEGEKNTQDSPDGDEEEDDGGEQ